MGDIWQYITPDAKSRKQETTAARAKGCAIVLYSWLTFRNQHFNELKYLSCPEEFFPSALRQLKTQARGNQQGAPVTISTLVATNSA